LLAGLFIDFGQQSGTLDQGHRRAVLGEEDICRRGVTLGHDLVAHRGVLALPDLHLNARLGRKSFRPWLGEILVLR
jgi:hypothetical protein